MKQQVLEQNFEIITGYTFRTALKYTNSGNYRVVQSKDLSQNLVIESKQLPKINFTVKSTNSVVKKGDILLSAKGLFKASIVNLGKDKIMASSSVYILRPKSDVFISKYVAIYLNSPRGQISLKKIAFSGQIKFIKQSDLKKIPITNLSLSRQQMIIDAYSNLEELNRLQIKQQEIYNNLINSLFSN
ncbi:hypothetical protein DRH14_01765 [Candidatus Shapirobacteria bacterium]|nr:MAG: hypothetical protein DRH14_01765 [Candidatus Shapirobacteria bacterium]